MLEAYQRSVVRQAETAVVASLPADTLMKKAAGAVADVAMAGIMRGFDQVSTARVLGLVGSGDNGGDCLYALRYLAETGANCVALLLGTKVHERALSAALRAHVHIVDCRGKDLSVICRSVRTLGNRCNVWIDGILGTGVEGKLREPYVSVINILNDIRNSVDFAPLVLAIDIPTGITSDDGTIDGPVLQADKTVTMGALKQSALLPPAAYQWGEVETVDLGLDLAESSTQQLELEDVAQYLDLPGPVSHKYTRGVVQIVAGSERFPSTGVLCASAAAQAGAGMVRVACPTRAHQALAMHLPEAVVGTGKHQCLVAGSGVDAVDQGQVNTLIQEATKAISSRVPVVLDAGAIAQYVEICAAIGSSYLTNSVVLTPHAGEAAEILSVLGAGVGKGGISRSMVEAAPARWGGRLAQITGAVVLLKGNVSLVCAPDGQIIAIPAGTPWAATAGSGDVLAGTIGAVLAQKQAQSEQEGRSLSAAQIVYGVACGAYLHAHAAVLASEKIQGGVRLSGPILASDISRYLPTAVAAAICVKPDYPHFVGISAKLGQLRAVVEPDTKTSKHSAQRQAVKKARRARAGRHTGRNRITRNN